MASVGEPFKHDVFISYSHGSVDGTGNSALKRWSDAFARELESEMKTVAKDAAALRVFLDNGPRPSDAIDPMSPLTEGLKASVDASAILIILMSPHYLRSAWCRDERDWWFAAQKDRSMRTDRRVAVARVFPTDAEWPAVLLDSRGQPMVGFPFYDPKPAEAETDVRPYDWPAPKQDSGNPFRIAVVTLAGAVLRNLEDFGRELKIWRDRDAEAQKLATASGLDIYLYGRADEEAAWETARQALSAAGHVVVPGLEAPEDDLKRIHATRRTRIKALMNCDALILVGAGDAASIDADMLAVGRRDRGAAVSDNNKLLPCAVLNLAGGAVATQQRRDNARIMKISWLDSVAEIPEWLKKPPL